MNGTDRAIQFILNCAWEALPAEVQRQSRRCLLDLLGALIAGAQTPVARLMADMATAQYAGDEATILAGGGRASAIGAALANGFAANALDIDDGYRPIKGHPGVTVLPPLLAAIERRGGLAGAECLATLVMGYEIAIRAGLIRHATSTTYHSSGSWGAIAGAAVAGRVLGFDAATLRRALGAAEYHAPIAPMKKGIDTPNMGKDSTGWGCMVGVASALMAQRGFTGIEPLFSESPQPAWIAGLGSVYEILNLYFKPYACCRWAQPGIAGALEIAGQARLAPADVASIRVSAFEATTTLSRAHPRDTEEAQYNLSYPIAAALLDGEVGPRQVLPPRLFDPDVLALADRVETVVEPAYEAAFPAKAYAHVEVTLRDGRRLVSGRKEAQWQPPTAPPSDAELEAKFRWLVEPLLGARRAGEIVAFVAELDRADDARRLIDLCVVRE
jgi:2-methylcitrate dehydratase PrpD